MITGEEQWRYQQAMWNLSDVVRRRNQSLVRLNSLTTLPLTISAGSGFIGAFDMNSAMRLLGEIARQTERINDALAEANQFADRTGKGTMGWMEAPHPPGEVDASED